MTRSAPSTESITSLDRHPNRFRPNCRTIAVFGSERIRAVGRTDTPGVFGIGPPTDYFTAPSGDLLPTKDNFVRSANIFSSRVREYSRTS